MLKTMMEGEKTAAIPDKRRRTAKMMMVGLLPYLSAMIPETSDPTTKLDR